MKLPKPARTAWNLRYWRNIAVEAAQRKGAKRSCDLCKRSMMGIGRIEIRPPWTTKKWLLRMLCSECVKAATEWVAAREYESVGYDLPIDWVSSRFTRGLPDGTAERRRDERS